MVFLSLGQNEDDLTRMRVGGMNPYVIPVHGLPWTSHVLGNFVSGHGKLMQKNAEAPGAAYAKSGTG